MLWNCVISLLFANIVKLFEVTIPSVTQKSPLECHDTHVVTRPGWCLGRRTEQVRTDLHVVLCWQGRVAPKILVSSSGTSFVFSSVPCYRECRSSAVQMCSLCCSGLVGWFVNGKYNKGLSPPQVLRLLFKSGYCSLENWVLMLSWSQKYSLTFTWHCINQCLVGLPLACGRQGEDWCGVWLQGLRDVGASSSSSEVMATWFLEH